MTSTTHLGPYELLERLGAGGMGVVYRARHRDLQADCALKVLNSDASDELRERFRREGEALARVGEHPNLIRVHSASEDRGQLFLVMEWVRGETLERLAGGRFPIDEALRVVRDLARGVQHVHNAGVLHRDVKPENVILTAEGIPKLVDFGLANMREPGGLTATGQMLGTPAYMAPEQARAERGTVGPAADVYGLGGVLFCLLAGRPPFEGGSVLGVLARVVEEPPPSLTSLRADVPKSLDELCLTALAKSPEDRPSAGDLADSLDAHLRGSASPVSGLSRPVCLSVAGLVVALAVALGVMGRAGGEAADRDPGTGEPAGLPVTVVIPDAAAMAAELKAIRSPLERLRRADDWLSRFPAHSEGAQVRELRGRAQSAVEPLRVLRGLAGADQTLLLAGGRVLRVRGEAGYVEVWEFGTASLVKRWKAHTSALAAGASADGTVFAFGIDGRVEVRSTATLDVMSSFGVGESVTSLAFSPDARTLVLGYSGPGVTVVNSADGTVLRRLEVERGEGYVCALGVSRDGAWIAAASRTHSGSALHDSRLMVWGASTALVATWPQRATPRSLAFTGKGSEVARGNQVGELTIFEPEAGIAHSPLTAGRKPTSVLLHAASHTGRVTALCARDGVLYSASGASFRNAALNVGAAAEGRNNDVAVWRRGPTGAWQNAGIYRRRPQPYTAIGISVDGQRLMLAGDSRVELWPIETFRAAPPAG